MMKILSLTWVPALMLTGAAVGVCASAPALPAAPAQFVITALPGPNAEKAALEPGELSVTQNGRTVPVLRLEQLTADRARMQLFILLDDSSRSSSLGVQIPELKSFIGAFL